MTSTEKFNLISKQWANVKDIMLLAECGRDKATLIRNEITAKIINEGKNVFRGRKIIIPMEYLVELLGLNRELIAKNAIIEQKIRKEAK